MLLSIPVLKSGHLIIPTSHAYDSYIFIPTSASMLLNNNIGCLNNQNVGLFRLQSRSSRISVKSTAASRGCGSWKGPSTRLRPVAPAMLPAPVPPSTLPAPHQVGKFAIGHTSVSTDAFSFSPNGRHLIVSTAVSTACVVSCLPLRCFRKPRYQLQVTVIWTFGRVQFFYSAKL